MISMLTALLLAAAPPTLPPRAEAVDPDDAELLRHLELLEQLELLERYELLVPEEEEPPAAPPPPPASPTGAR
jgi:hypothetical protein